MYLHTYDELVKAGVAIEVTDEEYLDVHGNVVGEFDETRLGNKTKFCMIHPRYLLFVDEVGSNTNAEKDKINSERSICHRDDRPQQVSSSSNHHYTTLPFTNTLGEPVCCVIIIAGETSSVLDTLGIDYCNMGADFLDQETTEEYSMRFFESNIADSKQIFPGGPICCVDGKMIPPFVTCSTSGGVTFEILTNSLKHIDEYLKLDLNVATPSLQIDRHGSRFEEVFLSYINPLKKTEVLAQKRRLFNFHSGVNLNKTDIVPIINYAFSKWFEVIGSNITAIATCG